MLNQQSRAIIMAKKDSTTQDYIPDIGSFDTAIRIIFVAVLIAIIITIGRNPSFNKQTWSDLNFLTTYALMISFSLVIALKIVSPLIKRLSLVAGGIVVFVLLLGVTIISSEAMFFLMYDLNYVTDRWPVWREDFIKQSIIVAAIVGIPGVRLLILRQQSVVEARKKQEAQMQALQSRIRPHFLFNSLNSVASLTRSDPEKAEAVLHDMADLFRVLLADARKLVPISAEREISRQYLEIEKIRLGNRLKVKWNVNNIPRAAQIPALTLQPLLENAIYHGIEPRFVGGTISIEMWSEDSNLNIMISNPLPDVSEVRYSKGNKIAQDNIRQRLTTQYGNTASMQSFQEGGQYHVKLKMPIVMG